MRGKKNVSNYLWNNYIFMIVVSFLLVIAILFLIVAVSEPPEKRFAAYGLTAESIMRDDIGLIDTSEIVKNRGSIDIVTSKLDVMHLAGKNGVSEDTFTMAEWTDFLAESHSADQNVIYSIDYNETGGYWIIVSYPVSISVKLYLAMNISDEKSFLEAVKIVLGVIFVYFCLIELSASLYSRITAKNFIRPIRKLCITAKNIENGIYNEKADAMPIVEFEEVRQGLVHLGNELNYQEHLRMEAENNKKTLIRDISHDLKNPLTSIRGYSEICLKDEALPDDKRQTYIQIINNNAVRANELIEGLFQYSQLDSFDFQMKPVKTDLCEVVRKKFAAFVTQLESDRMQYDAEIPEEDIYCMIDVPLINRVLDNLFENAFKYNKAGTKITVILKAENEDVYLTVMDDGVGMDADIAEHCFEPFSRADRTRNSKTGGSGLGLSIVKKIIHVHNGDIQLSTGIKEGCQFVIRLKREF